MGKEGNKEREVGKGNKKGGEEGRKRQKAATLDGSDFTTHKLQLGRLSASLLRESLC